MLFDKFINPDIMICSRSIMDVPVDERIRKKHLILSQECGIFVRDF